MDDYADIDAHVIDELREDFDSNYESITHTLCELEKNPFDVELLRALFRSVHTIKGNFGMVGLRTLADFVHAIENVLEQLRAQQLKFDVRMSDIFLLGIDRARDEFLQRAAGKTGNAAALIPIATAIGAIDPNKPDNTKAMNQVLRLLDPSYAENEPESHISGSDLKFFDLFARFLEDRAISVGGRAERTLAMATNLNRTAGRRVDEQQLTAAVYLHDIGMAFIDHEVLAKQGQLSPQERSIIQGHVANGAELLRRLGNWEPACAMVRQHHERIDGTGYPARLRGDEICDGAKIIAIADTYEAMTHIRADGRVKRPLLRVVAEINACAGTQFDRQWVEVFNQVIRQRNAKQ